MSEFKGESKPKHLEPLPEKPAVVFAADGRPLQRNQGNWKFLWTETSQTIYLVVYISKFLDTSLVDVDVNPQWVTVTIKGKVLQLTTDSDVSPENVICERSKVSGALSITMLKSGISGDIVRIRDQERQAAENIITKEKSEKFEAEKLKASRDRRYEGLFSPSEAVDYRNIVSSKHAANISVPKQAPEKKYRQGTSEDAHFIDDPTCPPLC